MKYRRRRRAEKEIKSCPHCQRSFAARKNAEHCSDRCRKAAWRAKEKQKVERLHALVTTLGQDAGLRPEELEPLVGPAEKTVGTEPVSQVGTEFGAWAARIRSLGLEGLT